MSWTLSDVDELVAKAKARVENADPVSKFVTLGDEMVEVRYTPIRGDQWRALKAQHLPRPGSFMDQNLGYNIDEAVRGYPGFTIVRGDEVDELRRFREDQKWHYIWPEIFEALEDPAIEILAQSLWETHENEPLQRMVTAGKALRAGQAKKRN